MEKPPDRDPDSEILRTQTLDPAHNPYHSLDATPVSGMRVEIVGGPMDGTSQIVEEDVITIGRAPDNLVPLRVDPLVSTHHARITREDGSFWLEDLESRNGTFLGNQRIEQRTPIGPGSLVYVGGTCLEFIPS